ncbi:hypothetical protein SLA2020_410030 [Shorea laevis]
MGKKHTLHNGWPPNVPPVAEMNVGEPFTVEMVDFSGGAVKEDDSALDIKLLDLFSVHYLGGSIRVRPRQGWHTRQARRISCS